MSSSLASPSPLAPLDELSLLLRPAGGGLYVVSTGKEAQLALQKKLYGAADETQVKAKHQAALASLATARGVLLGIPSDVGAGYVRGANFGPQAIREQLLAEAPDWPAQAAAMGLVDLGDVFTVPQLLHDEMLSAAQLAATRQALYPGLPDDVAATLPVSPLSIAERALELALALNPNLKLFALGGDHSTAWPVVSALARARARRGEGPWGIVQSDAHTDLLEARLGVKYCFATWSFHANELVGRSGRLVQVGVRASAKTQAHWEGTYGVRQLWAREIRENPAAALDAVLAHLKASGLRGVYFSNDIDGTDAAYADATGTPEPQGLEPDWLVELIRRLGREVGLLGGDVMEVAPLVQRSPDGGRRTLALAARYLRETLQAALPAPGS